MHLAAIWQIVRMQNKLVARHSAKKACESAPQNNLRKFLMFIGAGRGMALGVRS